MAVYTPKTDPSLSSPLGSIVPIEWQRPKIENGANVKQARDTNTDTYVPYTTRLPQPVLAAFAHVKAASPSSPRPSHRHRNDSMMTDRELGLVSWLPTLQEYEAHLEEEKAKTKKIRMKSEPRHFHAFALRKSLTATAAAAAAAVETTTTTTTRRRSTRVSIQNRRTTQMRLSSLLQEQAVALPRPESLKRMSSSCCFVPDARPSRTSASHVMPTLAPLSTHVEHPLHPSSVVMTMNDMKEQESISHDVARKQTSSCDMMDRIQASLCARAKTKVLFSHELLAILESFENDRWTCFCLKYAHFHIERRRPHRSFELDMRNMRQLSEMTRRTKIAHAIAHAVPWYMVLCAKVLEYDASPLLLSHSSARPPDAQQRQLPLPPPSSASSSCPSSSSFFSSISTSDSKTHANHHPSSCVLPPSSTKITASHSDAGGYQPPAQPMNGMLSPASIAARFILDAIRKIVHAGYTFQPSILLGIVLCLREEEFQYESTQAILTFLRRVVKIPLLEWSHFFESAHLPTPREVLERRRQRQRRRRRRRQQPPHDATHGMCPSSDLSLGAHENRDTTTMTMMEEEEEEEEESHDRDLDLEERLGEDWMQDDIFDRKDRGLPRRASLCRVKRLLRSTSLMKQFKDRKCSHSGTAVPETTM